MPRFLFRLCPRWSFPLLVSHPMSPPGSATLPAIDGGRKRRQQTQFFWGGHVRGFQLNSTTRKLLRCPLRLAPRLPAAWLHPLCF